MGADGKCTIKGLLLVSSQEGVLIDGSTVNASCSAAALEAGKKKLLGVGWHTC